MLIKDDYIIGEIRREEPKKQTLVSFLSGKENVDETAPVEIKKVTYTLDSVFPNEEILDIVLDEIDRNNREIAYRRLGIPTDCCNEISWEKLVALEEEMRQQQSFKNKLLAKIKRRGV